MQEETAHTHTSAGTNPQGVVAGSEDARRQCLRDTDLIRVRNTNVAIFEFSLTHCHLADRSGTQIYAYA